jgi:hypothetical protein
LWQFFFIITSESTFSSFLTGAGKSFTMISQSDIFIYLYLYFNFFYPAGKFWLLPFYLPNPGVVGRCLRLIWFLTHFYRVSLRFEGEPPFGKAIVLMWVWRGYMPKSSYSIHVFSYFAMHTFMMDLFKIWWLTYVYIYISYLMFVDLVIIY